MKKLTKKLAIFLFWICIWQLVYVWMSEDLLVVSPFSVAKRIAELSVSVAFWQNIFNSLSHIMLGFVLSIISGTMLAVLSYKFVIIKEALGGLVNVIKATPVASFILLALIFVKVNNLSVFTSFLMTFPLIWTNTLEGLSQVDGELLEMAKMFKLSTGVKLAHIYFPSLLPYLISACRVGLGFAWKSGIAAEVLARPSVTIGKSLYESKIYLETLDTFSWTAVIIMVSVILEKIFVVLVKKLSGNSGVKLWE